MSDERGLWGLRRRYRHQARLLSTVVVVAVMVAACGRASEREINELLGITPTATRSAEQIATATARAAERQAAEASAAAAAAASGSPAAVVLAEGDAGRGRLQFNTWCMNCHRAGGAGPDILAPGSTMMTAPELLAFLRNGDAHGRPPGPYSQSQLSDRTIADIAAYIAAQTGG